MSVVKHLPLWLIVLIGVDLGYGLMVVISLIKDARKTTWRESGCTCFGLASALFLALPLHTATIFVVWMLPVLFPSTFRVGGERIHDEECYGKE